MAFELKKNENVPKGVRRIVCKRIDKALEAIGRSTRSVSDTGVHEARKRFKEIRGVLRLVRSEIGEKTFQQENQTFRDAGRPLSELRDATVMIDSLDGLFAHFKRRIKPKSAAKFRRLLVGRRRDARKKILERDRAASDIVKKVKAARKRVEKWPLDRNGWKAIEGGLKNVYTQGRRAMGNARDDDADENLHEWRKRAKDLRYGMEFLEAIWPETIEPLAEQAHQLTNLLGDDHDLAVLRCIAEECESETPEEGVNLELLFALIEERRRELKDQARELGRKIFEESPAEFVNRMKGYWKAGR